MSETRERWNGPAGVTLFWAVIVVLGTCLLTGGYYWGVGTTTQTSANTRIDQVERAANVRMDKIETDVKARFDHDESDEKQIADLVHTVSDRLIRMDAQLDLIVKNVTTVGTRR